MHNFSYLRVMFALLIPDGFTQRCDHGITCHCRFRIQYNTHTHTHIRPHTHYLCFASHKPLVQLSLNFVCIWSVTRRSNHIKTSSWYEAILVMQMKVKGQISFHFLSQQPFVRLSSIFVCIWCDQTIILHNKIKLICGHLGYANEGQRSNLIFFCISGTIGPIDFKFCMHIECDQAIIS